MNQPLRSLLFGATLLLGSMAFAQPLPPYAVTVSGQITPCPLGPVNVTITSVQNTQPATDITIQVDSGYCYYSTTLMMDSPQGWFQVGIPCSGAMNYSTGSYSISFLDSTSVQIDLDCGVAPGDCQAAFSAQQAMSDSMPIPWQLTTTDLSTGAGPMTYQWWMPDGSASTDAEPTFTFDQAGVYGICLTITTPTCTSTHCDTLVVDSSGYINNNVIWFDCQGALWGTATVGTPCDDGNPSTTNDTWSAACQCVGQGGGLLDCLGVSGGNDLPGTDCTDLLGSPGTWSTACVCIADSSTTPCSAGFWVIQAYTIDSLNPQDTASVQPIPNEVWVWNLSSGGNGNYQFLWNFGDGTTSTEPYPTHNYDGDGPWVLCLTMTSDNCTDTYCDSVSVDANGILNGMIVDGHSTVAVSNSASRSGGFTLNVIQQIPTGITETPALADLNVWPNPVNDGLNISFNNSMIGSVPVTVIDPSGRTVISERHGFTSGGNTLRIPTGTLKPGLYMVRIGTGAKSVTKRFLKVQ